MRKLKRHGSSFLPFLVSKDNGLSLLIIIISSNYTSIMFFTFAKRAFKSKQNAATEKYYLDYLELN